MSYQFMYKDKIIAKFEIAGFPSFCGGYTLSGFISYYRENDVSKMFSLKELSEAFTDCFFELRGALKYKDFYIKHSDSTANIKNHIHLISAFIVMADKDREGYNESFVPYFIVKSDPRWISSESKLNPNSNNQTQIFYLTRDWVYNNEEEKWECVN